MFNLIYFFLSGDKNGFLQNILDLNLKIWFSNIIFFYIFINVLPVQNLAKK